VSGVPLYTSLGNAGGVLNDGMAGGTAVSGQVRERAGTCVAARRVVKPEADGSLWLSAG